MTETDASILVTAGSPATMRAQLDALAAAGLTERHELVVVSDGEIEIPRGLSARVTTRHSSDAGRREALVLAASIARGPVCIALASIARPVAGFVDPLVEAVHAGAGLAAPVLETCGGEVWGYRAAADGSLWPLREGEGAPDALALDCLAAPRDFWVSGLPTFDAVEGHYELHVARAAGSLAVAADARCRRRTIGPPLSVIVCTQDRPGEIVDCAEALLAAGADEIVVVDNGSGAPLGLPAAVKLVREPVPGLSRARNTGAAAASHDVLVYLDDDARPAPGWVEHMRDAFADPEVMVAGGPIHGLWPRERTPGWPQAPWTNYFSILSHGDADRTWPRGDFYGANWAVRRSALDEVGGFEHRWGASGDGLLAGEETAVEQLIAACDLGVARYSVGAAVGHRIDPGRCDEGWLALRVYRHGLAMPWIEAGFMEPTNDLAERLAREALTRLNELVRLEGTLDPDQALALCANAPLPLDQRLEAARALGTAVGSLAAIGIAQAGVGAAVLLTPPEAARGFTAKPHVRRSGAALRGLAIVPAFNEEDVIEHVVRDLAGNGFEVVLLDNQSTDRTVELARAAGADVETFESDGFTLNAQLERFEQIALERDHDWCVVCDADEFRESPWPGMTLLEALREVDALGYSAVNFELFNFRPTDDDFVPGTDVREHLTRYEPPESFDVIQIKCWQNPGSRVDLSRLFHEGAKFPNRRVFPVPFILRHYPIRSETHGRRKVLGERLPRYDAAEREDGFHVQYNAFADGESVVPLGSGRAVRVGRRRRARRAARARVARGAARPGRPRLRGRAHGPRRGRSGRVARTHARAAGRERRGRRVGAPHRRGAAARGRSRRGAVRPRRAAAARRRGAPGGPAARREGARRGGRPAGDGAAHRSRVRRRADREPRAARRLRTRRLGRRPAHARDRRRRHRRACRTRSSVPASTSTRPQTSSPSAPTLRRRRPSTRAASYADLPRFDESNVHELRALALRRAA